MCPSDTIDDQPRGRGTFSRRVAIGVGAVVLAATGRGLTGSSAARPWAGGQATPEAGTAAATPTLPPGAGEGIILAGSGLVNPRGFTWGADGSFYVTQAGSGGPRESDGTPEEERILGAFRGGLTGSVAYVGADGCPVTFQGGLPSSEQTRSGNTRGPAAVALLGGDVYVAVAGGGKINANPSTPNGIYAIAGDGAAVVLADLSQWVRDNPVARPPGDASPEGDPFAMVAGDDELWVVEANSGQLLRVGTDGAITRLVDFSGTHDVPSALARAADGTLYVGFLTTVPYTDGTATVVSVLPDGTVTTVWTGLTAVTALAIGPGGTLYAAEMGTGNTPEPPFIAPWTGRVVRQTGPDTLAEVATGLDLPVAMGFGPDGGLYVGLPAYGGIGASGAIVRLSLDQGQTLVMDPALLGTSTCAGANPTPSPSASPSAEPATSATASDAPSGDDAAPATGDAVSIADFAFGPATLQVSAGTTVTWTNADSAAHTVTADDGSFDSGNLSPGATFGHAFPATGTYPYHCTYHPNMTASIVVA